MMTMTIEMTIRIMADRSARWEGAGGPRRDSEAAARRSPTAARKCERKTDAFLQLTRRACGQHEGRSVLLVLLLLLILLQLVAVSRRECSNQRADCCARWLALTMTTTMRTTAATEMRKGGPILHQRPRTRMQRPRQMPVAEQMQPNSRNAAPKTPVFVFEECAEDREYMEMIDSVRSGGMTAAAHARSSKIICGIQS